MKAYRGFRCVHEREESFWGPLSACNWLSGWYALHSRSTSDNVPATVIGPFSLGDWTDLEDDLDQLWTPQRAELHDMVAIHSVTSALQRSSIGPHDIRTEG
jgi:hypothetical protein